MREFLRPLLRPAIPLALSFAAALAALPAHRAAAQLLAPVADGRYAHVEHCPEFEPCQSQSTRPPASFAAFDGEVSIGDMSASQQSSWSSGADDASTSGSLASGSPSEPPLGTTLGDAVFDLTFEATAAASYAWSGSGSLSQGGYGSAFLYDLTSDTILFERSLPGSIAKSGELTAGHRYQLFLNATTLGRGSADWSFEFSALPEPGLPAALAAGFALLALVARRRS
jgi:hypothetical protein